MNPRDFENLFKRNTIPAMPLSQTGCKKCADSGFAWLSLDKESMWAYCDCREGKNKKAQNKFQIPKIDAEILSVYRLEEFPIKSFMPDPFAENWKDEMWKKVRKFEESLKKSEKYWSEK